MTLTLRYGDIAADKPFHAALVAVTAGERRARPPMHTHADFYEIVYATGGHGDQIVGCTTLPMRRGFIALVRPHDVHDFTTTAAAPMTFINIAFPIATWHAFVSLTGLADAPRWERADAPPHAYVVNSGADRLTEQLYSTLRCYLDCPSGISLITALCAAIPVLQSTSRRPDTHSPDWFRRACADMAAEENLRQGVPRFRELAAVSAGHLARTAAQYLHCTPAEFVTARRLGYARFLLAFSTESITEIATRCGFSSPSYFSYRFRQRYRISPRDFRAAERTSVIAP